MTPKRHCTYFSVTLSWFLNKTQNSIMQHNYSRQLNNKQDCDFLLFLFKLATKWIQILRCTSGHDLLPHPLYKLFKKKRSPTDTLRKWQIFTYHERVFAGLLQRTKIQVLFYNLKIKTHTTGPLRYISCKTQTKAAASTHPFEAVHLFVLADTERWQNPLVVIYLLILVFFCLTKTVEAHQLL